LGGGDRSGTFAFEEVERGDIWKWCHNWEGKRRGEVGESRERGELRRERAEKGER
jgi:hypothetical protein